MSEVIKRPDFKALADADGDGGTNDTYTQLIKQYLDDRASTGNGRYREYNPLLDDNGNPVDYNGIDNDAGCDDDLGVDPTARGEILAAATTARSTIDAAYIEKDGMIISSAMEADAAVKAATIDAEARCYEADKNLEAVKIQAQTDIEIAKMEKEIEFEKIKVEFEKLKVETHRIDQVEVIQAQAAYRAAGAEEIEAEGKKAKNVARAESYLYGPSGGGGPFGSSL